MRTLLPLILFISQFSYALTILGPAKFMSISTRPPTSDPLARGAVVGYATTDETRPPRFVLFGAGSGIANEEIFSITLRPLNRDVPGLDLTNQLSLVYSYELDSQWTARRIRGSMRRGQWPEVSGLFVGRLMIDDFGSPATHPFPQGLKKYLRDLQERKGSASIPLEIKVIGKHGTTASIHFTDTAAVEDFLFRTTTKPVSSFEKIQACLADLVGLAPPPPPFQVFTN